MSWKKAKISDLGRIVTGKTPSTSNPSYWGGNIPFITPADLQKTKHISLTERSLTLEGANTQKNTLLPPNSICVSCIGNLGYAAVTTIPSVSNQQINSIIVNDENDIDFTYYIIKSIWPIFKNLEGQSTTLSIVNKTQFSEIDITIPDIITQKKISSALSSFDDKIELNAAINRNLEEQAKAIFKSWFIDFEPFKDGNFIDSELGKIPEGWKAGMLSDVLDSIESGRRPKGGIDKSLKMGIPSIGAESIDGISSFDYSKVKFINENFHQEMKTGILRPYDVLIYKDGAYIGKKSMTGIDFPYPVCTINEHVFLLRTNELLNPYYLYFSLKKEELEKLNTNSAQPGLNRTSILSLKILIPGKSALANFKSVCKPIFDRIFSNNIENRRLAIFRDSLLPKLINGEIELSEPTV